MNTFKMNASSSLFLILWFSILSMNTSFGQYHLVMTYGSDITSQRWKTRNELPKEEISTDWNDNYYLSHLSYDNDKWTIVSSKGLGYTQQAWRSRVEFPENEIKELWETGYAITDLTYGNGLWALVMSKGSEYSGQKWSTTNEFPKDKIKEYWDDGRSIIKIAYGQGKWALVGSKTNSISLQKWRTSASFPKAEIEENIALGYFITQLEYLNGQWVLVLSKYNDYRSQKLLTSETFPKDEIRNNWSSNYYITSVGYEKNNTTTEPDPILETTTAYKAPKNSTDPRVTGTWSGKSLGDTEEVEMTFDEDNLFTVITGGEVVGGKNYKVEDTEMVITYEVNMATIPHQIDIVFTVFDIESGRMKGIFEFIGKNEMRMLLPNDYEEARPKSFIDKSGAKPVMLKKINK